MSDDDRQVGKHCGRNVLLLSNVILYNIVVHSLMKNVGDPRGWFLFDEFL